MRMIGKENVFIVPSHKNQGFRLLIHKALTKTVDVWL